MQRIFISISSLILLTAIFCSFGVNAQSGPFFQSGQDPLGSGKSWSKIETMSDEFSGSSLDYSKWEDNDGNWRGRPPALFTPRSVTVSGGYLLIEASNELSPQERRDNPGYTHRGGSIFGKHRQTYGYFEARMKANKTAFSSTFWMINRLGDASGCSRRITELDITENVGTDAYPPGDDRSKYRSGFVTKSIFNMKANTHSRDVPSGCGIPSGSRPSDSPLYGGKASDNYHVYGVYWKNAKELIYFLDGKPVLYVTPPSDFNLGMYLRMVVESYAWNKPRPGFDQLNLPFKDRVTRYDWVRSWKVVDRSGDTARDQVDCGAIPNNVPTSTSITVPVRYSASQRRDVVVELRQGSTWIGSGRTTVNAGNGTTWVTINVSTPPSSGGGYWFRSSIRPQGASWQQNINVCEKRNVTFNGSSTVSCDPIPNYITTSTSIAVPVRYSASQRRDVVVELRRGSTWVGSGRTTVNAGNGTTWVTINVSTPPSAGGGYWFRASIRPQGASWQQNINVCEKRNVTFGNNDRTEVDCNSFDNTWYPIGRSINTSIVYTSDMTRDVVVELWRGGSFIGIGRSTAYAGTRRTNVRVNLNFTPPAGGGYFLRASIRPVNADWRQNLDVCEKQNITLYYPSGRATPGSNTDNPTSDAKEESESSIDPEGNSAENAPSATTIDRISTPAYDFNQHGNTSRIYPNPLGDSDLTVVLPTKANGIEVFDARGRRLMQRNVEMRKTTIDRSVFPSSGIYFIRLTNDDEIVETKRFIIR